MADDDFSNETQGRTAASERAFLARYENVGTSVIMNKAIYATNGALCKILSDARVDDAYSRLSLERGSFCEIGFGNGQLVMDRLAKSVFRQLRDNNVAYNASDGKVLIDIRHPIHGSDSLNNTEICDVNRLRLDKTYAITFNGKDACNRLKTSMLRLIANAYAYDDFTRHRLDKILGTIDEHIMAVDDIRKLPKWHCDIVVAHPPYVMSDKAVNGKPKTLSIYEPLWDRIMAIMQPRLLICVMPIETQRHIGSITHGTIAMFVDGEPVAHACVTSLGDTTLSRGTCNTSVNFNALATLPMAQCHA